MSSIKRDRAAERMQIVLSELLLREISDPRLKNVTVTEVTLDPELMFATVYVNALGDESRQEKVMAGLDRAKGFLRREIGKALRLRNVPELLFRWDVTLERGERMNQLIASLKIPAQDEMEVHDDDSDDKLERGDSGS